MASMALTAGWLDGPSCSRHAMAGGAVREALRGETRAIARMLARASAEEPALRWLLPSSKEWARGGARFHQALLRDGRAHGLVLTSHGLRGAAVWTPPGPVRSPWRDLEFRLRMLRVLGRRSARALRLAERMQAAHPSEPHWYLRALGTDPDHQRGGIASRLLEPVLDHCDAERLPAYLETSTPSHVAFYRRRGFQVRDRIGVPGGPPILTLWREPCS
jgi:GNAT superfamily N-acetyltransferase